MEPIAKDLTHLSFAKTSCPYYITQTSAEAQANHGLRLAHDRAPSLYPQIPQFKFIHGSVLLGLEEKDKGREI